MLLHNTIPSGPPHAPLFSSSIISTSSYTWALRQLSSALSLMQTCLPVESFSHYLMLVNCFLEVLKNYISNILHWAIWANTQPRKAREHTLLWMATFLNPARSQVTVPLREKHLLRSWVCRVSFQSSGRRPASRLAGHGPGTKSFM